MLDAQLSANGTDVSTDPTPLPTAVTSGPFDSLRDYLAAVEDRRNLLRIDEMDQDRYEASAFAYRLVEERDLLGIFSAARIGYYQTVPTVSAANAKQDHVYFESFESCSLPLSFSSM